MSTNPQDYRDERYIVGLRFQRVGKIYNFDASGIRELKPGDFAVVETSRGLQLGQIIQIMDQSEVAGGESIKPILRQATPQDLVQKQVWEQKEAEALRICQENAAELDYKEIKIVSAEFSFDGSHLYFLYNSEEGDKSDLKRLRRTIQRLFPQIHIELHVIGPRDVAKIMGGMGACGLENRCCSAFMTDFSPISIKMAKEQGISLTPTEITGMCGRLRCCLAYEYPQYFDARKKLPKRGKYVNTPMGVGKIIDTMLLKGVVLVDLEAGGQYELNAQEVELIEDQEAIKQKAGSPSDDSSRTNSRGKKRARRKRYG